MYRISQIAHTADLCLRLEADSLEELLLAGQVALNGIMKPDACQKPCPSVFEHIIMLQASDNTVLLIDFLSELLTQMHTHKAVFCQLEVEELESGRLKARIGGRPAGGFEEDVKAVTYHRAEVQRNEAGRWETLLVLDI